MDEYEKLKEENKQLKEALRKSNPCHGFGKCWSCNADFRQIFNKKKHNPNCEYIRLTKESEDK